MSKLEDFLNLPKLKDALAESENTEDNDMSISDESIPVPIATEQEYETSIQSLEDLDALVISDELLHDHDESMDEIAKVAFDHHKTFMDLSIDVMPKEAEAYVSGAVQMLNISLNAKKEKIDKRLRLKRLQFEKERLDFQKQQHMEKPVEGKIVEGAGNLMVDRNDMLAHILKNKEEDK